MRHSRIWALVTALAVVVLALSIPQAPANAATPTTVAGRVSEAGGRALAGVVVQVFDAAGVTLVAVDTTSSTGHYRVRLAGSADHQVLIFFEAENAVGGTSATGYADTCLGGVISCHDNLPGRRTVTLHGGTTTSNVNIALPAAAQLSGRLTDTLGRGVGGVTVDSDTGITDADNIDIGQTFSTSDNTGNWVLRRLFPTTVAVCFGYYNGGSPVGISAPVPNGYLGECWRDNPFKSGAGNTFTLTPEYTQRNVNAVLAGNGAVTGKVVDEAGNPVAGATVQVGEDRGGALVIHAPTATTAADGTYRVPFVNPDTAFLMCVTAAGYTDRCPSDGSETVYVTAASFRSTAAPDFVLHRSTTSWIRRPAASSGW